jgi:hypothetical protein
MPVSLTQAVDSLAEAIVDLDCASRDEDASWDAPAGLAARAREIAADKIAE